MPNSATKILIAVVAIVGVILLFGYRFGFRAAGGEGTPVRSSFAIVRTNSVEANCVPDSEDQIYNHFMTCADQYSEVEYRWEKGFGGADIALDERTDIMIVDDTRGSETISLLEGRIVVSALSPITVTVRDVAVTIDGLVTLVHYSWQDKLDIMVIDGVADVRQGTITSTVTSDRAVMIDTLPPYDAITPTTFNLDASTAKSFYGWTLSGD